MPPRGFWSGGSAAGWWMSRLRERRLRRIHVTFPLLAVALSGCTAAAGAGVLVAGIGASALALGCDDPVGVTVWTPESTRGICTASVVAVSSEGAEAAFSPCYRVYLGDGTWTITASLPGYAPASGMVIVQHPSACEPVFHSLELSLAPLGGRPVTPVAPVPAPGAASTPPGTPLTGSSAPESAAPPASTPTAPAPAAPAPAATANAPAAPPSSVPAAKAPAAPPASASPPAPVTPK